jgi:hypothetical protein
MTMTSRYVTLLERELHYVAALDVPGADRIGGGVCRRLTDGPAAAQA